MGDVTGRNPRERASTERVVARDTATHPCVRRDMLEECNRGGANGAEFIDVAPEGSLVGARRPNRGVLVETGKRRLIAARKPEGAIREDALGVVQMTDDFADGPLVRSVAMER